MNVCDFESDAQSVVVFEQALEQEHLDSRQQNYDYDFGHPILLHGVLVLHYDFRVDALAIFLEFLLLGDVVGFARRLHQYRVQLVDVAFGG